MIVSDRVLQAGADLFGYDPAALKPIEHGGAPGQSVITPAPEVFEIGPGKTVEVFDVAEAGLNVREGPGTGFVVLFIAQEGARFTVTDGPQEIAGFTWWELQSADNPALIGWAVADFLRVPGE